MPALINARGFDLYGDVCPSNRLEAILPGLTPKGVDYFGRCGLNRARRYGAHTFADVCKYGVGLALEEAGLTRAESSLVVNTDIDRLIRMHVDYPADYAVCTYRRVSDGALGTFSFVAPAPGQFPESAEPILRPLYDAGRSVSVTMVARLFTELERRVMRTFPDCPAARQAKRELTAA